MISLRTESVPFSILSITLSTAAHPMDSVGCTMTEMGYFKKSNHLESSKVTILMSSGIFIPILSISNMASYQQLFLQHMRPSNLGLFEKKFFKFPMTPRV